MVIAGFVGEYAPEPSVPVPDRVLVDVVVVGFAAYVPDPKTPVPDIVAVVVVGLAVLVVVETAWLSTELVVATA